MRVVEHDRLAKTKLCHARAGDVVRIHDEKAPEGGSEPFLVCVNVKQKGQHINPLAMHGLYTEERGLFLVSLADGSAVSMPHLSSRVEVVRQAKVVLGHEPSQRLIKAEATYGADGIRAGLDGAQEEREAMKRQNHAVMYSLGPNPAVEIMAEAERTPPLEGLNFSILRPSGGVLMACESFDRLCASHNSLKKEADKLRGHLAAQIGANQQNCKALQLKLNEAIEAANATRSMAHAVGSDLRRLISQLDAHSPSEVRVALKSLADNLARTAAS